LGPTAFSEEELKVINHPGSEEDKTAFTIQQGVEILDFIDRFLMEKNSSLQPLLGGNTVEWQSLDGRSEM
jgi:hypothetical protein